MQIRVNNPNATQLKILKMTLPVVKLSLFFILADPPKIYSHRGLIWKTNLR